MGTRRKTDVTSAESDRLRDAWVAPKPGKPGRPRKQPLISNVADVSIEGMRRLHAAISPTLDTPDFQSFFSNIQGSKRTLLIERLVYEVAVYPALQGLEKQAKSGHTGPKHRFASRAFLATVRDALKGHGVQLPQWANSRKSRMLLTQFCQAIARAGNVKLAVSVRTGRNLPVNGFSPE